MSKQAPPREDIQESPVDLRSRGFEIDNKDPNFDYQFFSSDPKHPQYHGNARRPRRLPNGEVMAPWVYVTDDNDQVRQGHTRTDQGAGVDTAYRNGSMVLMKTPKTETAKYQKHVHNVQKSRMDSLKKGLQPIGGTTISAGISLDPNAQVNDVAGFPAQLGS